MIKIDPLYVLLLAELALILAAGIAILYLKMRKYRILHRDTLKSLAEAKQKGEELRQKLSVEKLMGSSEGDARKSKEPKETGAEELEQLKVKLQETEAKLKEKSGKVEQLEAKISGLEKEYLVLYQQQQKQQEQPDIP